MKWKKRLLVLLVAAGILYGVVVILVSLLANQKRFDRETAFAAARHDGEALLATFGGSPFEALDYVETETGPLAPDLARADEAWVVWKQLFSAAAGLPAAVAWHRERLPEKDWTLTEEGPDKATFRKTEWTVTLERLPQADPPRFVREVKWNRDPGIL